MLLNSGGNYSDLSRHYHTIDEPNPSNRTIPNPLASGTTCLLAVFKACHYFGIIYEPTEMGMLLTGFVVFHCLHRLGWYDFNAPLLLVGSVGRKWRGGVKRPHPVPSGKPVHDGPAAQWWTWFQSKLLLVPKKLCQTQTGKLDETCWKWRSQQTHVLQVDTSY